MIGLFKSLKGFLKRQEIQIDNVVCQLHYKVTVLILMAFSLAVTSQQYLGSPIECHHDSKVDSSFVNTYCWITSTYSVTSAFDKGPDEVIYPGVDKYIPGVEKKHHAYYQWVCFALFVQAAMFYLPRWLWKIWEGGKVGKVIRGLDDPMLSDADQKDKTTRLVQYLLDHRKMHNLYAFRYFLCEALNLINVIGQIYFVDKFLGGEFTTYGLRVIDFMNQEPEERHDPMIRVFPRMSKCIVRKYGSSADIERISVLCILPLNVFNEKIYVFIWFWFVALSVLTGLIVGYRVVLFLVPKLRVLVLKTVAKTTPMKDLQVIMDHSQIGDWFLLYTLGRNAEPMNFKRMLMEYSFNLRCEVRSEAMAMTENQYIGKINDGVTV